MKAPGPKVIVSVHGYAGDEPQVRAFLPLYEHHGHPVVIFSPSDSPIIRMGPHICRQAGQRAYIGVTSLVRQAAQLRLLLDYGADYYLANDSDSFCISPKLPEYLFSEDVLWSNEVCDDVHSRPPGYAFPHLAFQPPYFFSRAILKRLVECAEKNGVNLFATNTPFIDWVMMAWGHASDTPHKNFPSGASCPTSDSHSLSVMTDLVQNHGRVMVHSIKTVPVMKQLIRARTEFLRTHP